MVAKTPVGLITVRGILYTVFFVVLLRGYRKADLTSVYALALGWGVMELALD